MEMFMKVIGSVIRLKVKESTHTWMEPNIKVNGRKINSMEKEKKHGLMGQCMRVIISWVKSMEQEDLDGQMDQFIMGSSLIIILKELGSISGLTEEPIMVNGEIIKCMAKEFSRGQTVESTKESMWKIRSKDKVLFTGLMEENTLVNG
jgi:hypothetical protein